MKTNNVKTNGSLIAQLIFEIQLLVQSLCSGKETYLLWSTGQGIIFNKFQPSEKLLKIFDILIELAQKGNDYSLSLKKAIVQELISDYTPLKLISQTEPQSHFSKKFL